MRPMRPAAGEAHSDMLPLDHFAVPQSNTLCRDRRSKALRPNKATVMHLSIDTM